jgi:multidrug efflux system membrane fusion protein
MSDDKMDVESVTVVDSPTGEKGTHLLPEHAGNGTAAGHAQRALPAGRKNPQDEKSGWLGKLISFLIVMAMVVGGYFAYPWAKAWLEGGGAKTRPTPRPAPVVLARARRGDLPIYLDEIGTVTALNTVTIHTRVDGQLTKLGFTEGQIVEEGQVLAELDKRPFQVQLDQAKGNLARDQAILQSNQADLKKYTEAGDAVSRQQVDTAAAAVKQAQGNIEADGGAIQSAELNITYCTITSPVTGKIGLRAVDDGNIVHASDANGIAVITQIQPISVLFSISQDDVPRVLKKMNAGEKLAVEVYDRGLVNKLATGTLESSDSEMDQTTGNLRFKATFGNQDGNLFPNQFVNVRVLVETLKGVVIVPTAAVQISPDSQFIYVMHTEPAEAETKPAGESADNANSKGKAKESSGMPEGVVEMRTVQVGQQQDEESVITKGIEPGDEVVTDGVDKLQDGATVSVGRAAATNPSSSDTATSPATTGPRKRRNS